jgi:tetratricopeptide (TPR) repeat protein
VGKVVKYTGSRALAAELRRLRGTRTLDEISALTKSGPLAGRIKPVSPASLCQTEKAQNMPTLETLHALAAVYRVNPQRLYNLIVEDRLIGPLTPPETLEATHALFKEAMKIGRWAEALGLAAHAERLAPVGAARVAWRANRAACLSKQGMRDEAIVMLQECADDPRVDPDVRHRIFVNLASVYADAGLPTPAAEAARLALETAPADARTDAQVQLLRSRASHVLWLVDAGLSRDERSLREALSDLDRARALTPDEDIPVRLGIEVEKAVAHRFLGNEVLAAHELQRVVTAATQAGLPRLQMHALANIGMLRSAQRRWVEAEKALRQAEPLALELEEIDAAFAINFELHQVAVGAGAPSSKRRHYLKRCQRYHPLVSRRSLSVQRYEELVGGAS